MAQTPAGTPEYTEQHFNAFLDRLLTTADRTVYEHIDLGLHHNVQYDQAQLLDLLAHCGLNSEFANGGAKTRRHETDGTVVRSDTRCPISRALGRHLRHLDFASITSQFDAVFEELHSLTRNARLLPRQADVAIDIHDWRYYGDPDTGWVLHTNLARGTNTAFKFLTACIVTEGCRLTVAAEPIRDDDHLPRLVDLMLTAAAEWVDIRRVFLDRGFYEVRFLQVLEAHDVDYVVRARRFPSLDDGDPTIRVEEGYRMGGSRPPYDVVTLTRFCVPHAENPDEKQSYFVTNRRVDEASAQAVADSYRRRWGIETSYRVIGEFLPRSRSTYFQVRLFYFLFAVSLYNLWVVVNGLLSMAFGRPRDDPLLTAAVFGRSLRDQWMPDRADPG
jgi:hypothetical protein